MTTTTPTSPATFWLDVARAVAHCQTCLDRHEVFVELTDPGPGARHELRPCPTCRPEVGARVAVTFPGNDWHDPETVTGTVVAHHPDAIDVRRDDDGETFSLFDRELADGRARLETTG